MTINPIRNLGNAVSLGSFFLILAIALMSTGAQAATGPGISVQYIQVKSSGSSAEFVQINATTWKENASSNFRGEYSEIRRTPTVIRLQNRKTNEMLNFNFASKIVGLKHGNSPIKEVGKIEKIVAANSYTVRGFSVVQTGSKERQQIDLDQVFTDKGKPSGWKQAVYTAPGVPKGTKIPSTNGNNIERVITQEGTVYVRLPDVQLINPGTGKPAFVKIWGEFAAFSKENANSKSWDKDMDMMAKPLHSYVETSRQKFLVNLVLMTDYIRLTKGNSIQFNLEKKFVKRMKNGSTMATVNISPEFFPGSGQFRRISHGLKTDNQIGLSRPSQSNGAMIKVSGHTLDMYSNQCSSGRGFNTCEVLLGSYAPRSLTGHSIGSFELKFKNRKTSFDVLAIQDTYNPGFSMKQLANGGAKLTTFLAMHKARNAIQFWTSEYEHAGTLDLTNGQFTPSAALKDTIVEGPVKYLREFYSGQFKNEVPIPIASKGPGFQITNKTDFPILISIDQVGCLEHGIIGAGETFSVDTGSVWFTVVASMSPDLADPTDLECATQPLIMAGGIVITGVVTAFTAGGATVPVAMLFAAVGAGAAAGAEAGLIADGMSEEDARLAGAGIMLLSALGSAGVTTIMSSAVGATTTEVAKQVAIALAKTALIAELKRETQEMYLIHVTTDEELEGLAAELEQKVSKAGVYAGHTWPWPVAEQTKAIFEITGGPTQRLLSDGKTVEFTMQTRELTITELPRQ